VGAPFFSHSFQAPLILVLNKKGYSYLFIFILWYSFFFFFFFFTWSFNLFSWFHVYSYLFKDF
jgi:hypothetical protein